MTGSINPAFLLKDAWGQPKVSFSSKDVKLGGVTLRSSYWGCLEGSVGSAAAFRSGQAAFRSGHDPGFWDRGLCWTTSSAGSPLLPLPLPLPLFVLVPK